MLAAVGPFPSLRNYLFEAQYARDYRGVVQFIDANARAGDGLLVNAPAQIDVVRYSWRSDQQLFLLPTGRPPDAARTRADVDAMLGKVTRLFAIYYATQQSDPQSIVETQLGGKRIQSTRRMARESQACDLRCHAESASHNAIDGCKGR